MLEIPDYGAYLQRGQGLVPDYAQQQLQQREMNMLEAQERRLAAAAQQEQEQIRINQQRDGAFRAATEAVMVDPNPDAIARLAIQFPEKAEELKKGWELMDVGKRQSELQQMGEAYGAAMNGKYDIAAGVLRKRVEADKAAGLDDPIDNAILAALESGDPVQQKAALGQMGYALAALAGPEKFSGAVKDLMGDPQGKTSPFMVEYNDRVAQFGKAAADEWAAIEGEKFIPVEGIGVFKASDLIGGGGGQASSGGSGLVATPEQVAAEEEFERRFPDAPKYADEGPSIPATGAAIESTALSLVPGIVVTSRKRSAAKNREVGGVPNSFHLTDQARDFLPPKGMSMAQLATRLRGGFRGFDVINEGDHVHVEPSSRQGTGRPIRVKSIQQANALPRGTIYLTPDGRTMKR